MRTLSHAAYAPAFLSGQGTSIALAGAYVLAGELARHDQPQQAFAAYEQRLRPYVEKNQNLALRTDSTVISRTRGQLMRRNLKLSMVPWLRRFGLDRLSRPDLRAAATDLCLASHDRHRLSDSVAGASPGGSASRDVKDA